MGRGAVIYLDNAASTYPKPRPVLRALNRAVEHEGGNPGRSSHALSLAAAIRIDNTRTELSELIGARDPSHIVFTLNATHAINLAIKGRAKRSSHILISDREHNAVYRPVCRLAREGVVDFDVFSTRGDVEKNILALLRPNTDMLVCNHVSNVDGALAPIERIGALCARLGIYFIVDASQSIGHRPFSLATVQADAVCAPGHKGLFGVQGVGFLWLKDGRGLSTLLEGGSGSGSLDPEMPASLPEKMEAGTPPTPAIAALGAGVRYLRSVTPEAVFAHETALLRRICDRLQGLRGLHLCTSGEGGILSLAATGLTPDRMTELLDERDICVRGGLHCAPLAHAALGTQRTGTVRVSLSYHTTEADADRLCSVITDILESR